MFIETTLYGRIFSSQILLFHFPKGCHFSCYRRYTRFRNLLSLYLFRFLLSLSLFSHLGPGINRLGLIVKSSFFSRRIFLVSSMLHSVLLFNYCVCNQGLPDPNLTKSGKVLHTRIRSMKWKGTELEGQTINICYWYGWSIPKPSCFT